MKLSIAISILILAAVGFIGWGNQKRISENVVTKATLSAEAAALGISLSQDGTVKIQRDTKSRGGVRADREAEIRRTAMDFIAFAKDMEEIQAKGEKMDEEMNGRLMDFMDRMISLDSNQLKVLIKEFRASTDLKEETRNNLVMFAIMTLSNDHPQAALSLLTEDEDSVQNENSRKHLLRNSLSNWAAKDPGAALEWVRTNSDKFGAMITDEVKEGLVRGAAQNDINIAFDLIAELKSEKPERAFDALARSANTAAKRTEFLELLRKNEKSFGEKSAEIMVSALRNLAAGISKDGFETGSQWMVENKISQQEIDSMGTTIGQNSKGADTGKWITWMGENVSEKKRNTQIESAMQNWTRTDFRAAGEWLAKEPDSPTKQVSVSSYATTVAAYDPQTATQWALTLPKGEARKSTLTKIYSSWPRETDEDKAGREAFKVKYEIGK